MKNLLPLKSLLSFALLVCSTNISANKIISVSDFGLKPDSRINAVPFVQKAINDMEKYLNEKHGKVQEAEQTVEVKQKVSETPFKKESVSVESNREQNKEPAKGGKGELKKSVLQSLKEFQARAKAQEQKEMATEKSKAHKKGNIEL